MAKTYHTGGLELTQDEALEFTLHHLALAGLFFMTATEDLEIVLPECLRMLGSGTLGVEDPTYIAALVFLIASHKARNDARSRDPL